MKVLVADHDALFRRFIRRVLENQPDCHLAGEAVDFNETMDAVTTLTPDLVLIGMSLPYRGGLEATRRIKAVRPATRVVVFSEAGGEAYRDAAEHAGAECLVLKNAEIVAIVKAIRSGGEAGSAQRSA